MAGVLTNLVRRVFGADRAYKGWRQFAGEVGGEYVDRGVTRPDPNDPGRWLFGPWVEVHFAMRGHPAILETYLEGDGETTQRFTNLRVTIPLRSPVQFHVFRSGVLGRMGTRLGMQDLQIGDLEFDRAFTVKGTDGPSIRSLLDEGAIRQALAGQADGAFGLRPTAGPGGGDPAELYFEAGEIRELDRLKTLSRLLEDTIDRAQRLGWLVGT
jgi:hypothetical protein